MAAHFFWHSTSTNGTTNFFASFNNDGGVSLDDKTKDYADINTGGQVNSLHEVTQLG